MGVGWLSSALGVGLRLSLPDHLAEIPAVRNTSAVAFVIFGVCFVYVAFTSVLKFFFPAL
jgi:hypothetical protein